MTRQTKTTCLAFTLVEVVVVLMLGAMLLTAVLGIYQQVRGAGAVILEHMEKNHLQTEILQKIAEDIDRLAAPGFEATINFSYKNDHGYQSSRLVLENSYYGNGDKKDTYERVIWQTVYDSFEDALVLYRMHEGLNSPDPVLLHEADEPPFVPVAVGLTHFLIRAQQGESVLGAWSSETLPKAARVEISFDLFEPLPDGTVGLAPEKIQSRTIAIDRTRMIPFQFVKKKFDLPEEDPNDIGESNAVPEDMGNLPELPGLENEPDNED